MLRLWDNWRGRYAVQILAVFCFTPTVFGQATGGSLSPLHVFAASTVAQSVFELSLFLLSITAAIFVGAFALIAYTVVKFRRMQNDELAWTVIPVLLVLALFWQERK